MNKLRKLSNYLFGKSKKALAIEQETLRVKTELANATRERAKLDETFKNILSKYGKVYTIYHERSLLPLDHYSSLNKLATDFDLSRSSLYRGLKDDKKTYSIDEYTIVKVNE